jgi:hypothetical protein
MRPLIALLVIVAALAGALLAIRSGADENDPERRGTRKPAQPSVPSVRIAGLRNSPVIGLADNRPETILDPRFGRSGIKRIRVQVPYDDIARRGIRLRYLDHWFDTAKRHGIEPLVAFYRSYRSRYLLPSAATFRRNFRLFRKRYPWVRHFSTWDEANFPDAQPTGDDPRRTAEYYRAARSECSDGRCTVVTVGFRADGSAHSSWWLGEFKRHIGRGPHTWGLVAHPDVNRFQTLYTRDFLRSTRGPVWVTEVGAINFFGRGLPPSISRQTRAMRYLMSDYARVSRRIRRMYVYHWRAAPGNDLFDSALLSVEGQRRPAYRVFFRALGRRAP